MPNFVSRRTFLKAGLLGSLLLAGAGLTYRLLAPAPLPEPFSLDAKAHAALAAIVPAMLKDALGPDQVNQAIAQVQQAIAQLPLATQNEIRDLFALLTLAPARRFAAGLKHDWSGATPAEVADFLQSWRLSRFGLLQSAYHALHDLITGSWYANDSTWATIGYPGPPKELS